MKFPVLFSSVLLCAIAGFQSAGAAILLADYFTDGALEGGADNSGISWFNRSANTGTTVVNDAGGIGTGNALQMAITSTGAQNNRGIVGKLSQTITLAAPGDTLSLSFSFRLLSKGGATVPNSSGTTAGFTFGFYNSNGSPIPDGSVNSGASDNDYGFRGEFGSGTNSRVAIFKEANTSASAGGLGTGTDGLSVTMDTSTPVAVGDFLAHTANITLTYISATSMGISLTYDGNVVATGNSSLPYFAFDEVVFSQGPSNGFILDNVVVTSNVPEPGSALLAALCGAAMLVRRRR